MNIYIGSDHAGYVLKEEIQAWLKESRPSDHIVDLGAFSEEAIDYPEIAREVSEKVYENEKDGAKGILICGSGEGMCMTANKHRGIRAALADTAQRAGTSREHNNANIVCFGSRFTDLDTSKEIVNVFLDTEFSGAERHLRRVEKMNSMD